VRPAAFRIHAAHVCSRQKSLGSKWRHRSVDAAGAASTAFRRPDRPDGTGRGRLRVRPNPRYVLTMAQSLFAYNRQSQQDGSLDDEFSTKPSSLTILSFVVKCRRIKEFVRPVV